MTVATRRASSRPTTRLARKEDTRRRLLMAGRRLFRSRGVENVAMEDVALAAKVSRATVYLHFNGKPALLEALLLEDWDGQMRLFDRLATIDLSDEAPLREWVMSIAEGMMRARDSFAIHRAALGQNPDLTLRHLRHRQDLAGRLLAAVDGAAAANSPDEAKPNRRLIEAEFIAAELEFFATGAALGWSAGEVEFGADVVTERIRAFALAGN